MLGTASSASDAINEGQQLVKHQPALLPFIVAQLQTLLTVLIKFIFIVESGIEMPFKALSA